MPDYNKLKKTRKQELERLKGQIGDNLVCMQKVTDYQKLANLALTVHQAAERVTWLEKESNI